jgi:CBS domain-containing protein
MIVNQLMNKNVHACTPETTLSEAARIMWEWDLGFLPVVDGESRVIGAITDRDICMAAYTQGVPLRAIKVESAMAREVRTCTPDETLPAAQAKMRKTQIRRLPVIDDDGHVVGIISLADLAQDAHHVSGAPAGHLAPDEVTNTYAAIARRPANAKERNNHGDPLAELF